MATNEIDRLEINVKVTGLTSASINNVNALTQALTKLNKAVSNVSNLKNYAKSLSVVASAVKSVGNTSVGRTLGAGVKRPATEEVSRGVSNGSLPSIPTKGNKYDFVEITRNLKQVDITSKSARTSQVELAKAFNVTAENSKNLSKSLEEQKKQTERTSNGWGRFIRSIGRIALYRTIRRALQTITQAMKEGIQNYAQYSDSTNLAISNIKSSVGQLKNTMGVTLGYVLESLAPILIKLSEYAVEFFNKINMALQVVRGESKYSRAIKQNIKQNEDYAKSLKKVNDQLLSFDKFETLKKSDSDSLDPSEMFVDEDIPENLDSVTSSFVEIFTAIKDTISAIKSLKGTLKPFVDDLRERVLPSLADFLNIINGLAKILSGDWTNGLNKLTNSINKWAEKRVKWAIDPFGLGWYTKAEGGMVTQGTAFIAGEAGAEVVATSSRGTGVTNIEQFTIAMVNALTAYGASRGSDLKIGGDIIMNSTKVGQIVEKSVFNEGVRVGHFSRV